MEARPELDTTSPALPRPRTYRLTFHGGGASLFGIYVVNVFLTLLTLGIYSFWAKVRVRRFLFSQTELDYDRFAYHGLGGELLRGFLKAAVVLGIPLFALKYLPELLDATTLVKGITSVVAYSLVMMFLPIARVGARRYRLSRTSWRGIRFSFHGRAVEFIRVFVTGWLLTALTLGFYYPIYMTRNQAFMVRHSYFGSAKFDFDGRGSELMVDFLYTLLLTLPTFGLCWFWFVARKRRYFWEHTAFRDVRFHSTVTGGRLFRLKLGNLLLILLTLGLGWPFASIRNARFACTTLSVEGVLDLTGIRQEPTIAWATGEGLLSFLETDFDLG